MTKQSYNIKQYSATNRGEKYPPGAVSTPDNSPLGIYANKVATPDIQQVTDKPTRARLNKVRALKSQKKLSSHRSCACGRKPLGGHVEVHYNPRYNSAKVANLETCGSVWECPVCRNKIMSKRADQLKALGDAFRGDGGHTFMATFTVPHYKHQPLSFIIGDHKLKTGFAGAIARMRQHREFRAIKHHIGYVADCRSLETTYGANWWHLHSHWIFYVTNEADKADIEARFYDLWENVCLKAGLGAPTRERGVKVTDGVDQYLAKWGAPNEVMSGTAKDAKNGNRSVAELESSLLDGDQDAELLLWEYYSTMRGRKMLTWAGENIRKQYLDDPDITDQELAEDQHGDGERLFIINGSTWKHIYNTMDVGRMLTMIEYDRERGIFDFLNLHGIDPGGGITRTIKQQCTVDIALTRGALDPCYSFINN